MNSINEIVLKLRESHQNLKDDIDDSITIRKGDIINNVVNPAGIMCNITITDISIKITSLYHHPESDVRINFECEEIDSGKKSRVITSLGSFISYYLFKGDR